MLCRQSSIKEDKESRSDKAGMHIEDKRSPGKRRRGANLCCFPLDEVV